MNDPPKVPLLFHDDWVAYAPDGVRLEPHPAGEGLWVEVTCSIEGCWCEPMESFSHCLCHTHFWMLPLVLRRNLWRKLPGCVSDATGWLGRNRCS